MKYRNLSRALQVGIILAVVYFSQVYPFVHFHHTHTDCDVPIEVSVHPMDSQPHHSQHDHDEDRHHQEDGEHHHHHEFDKHVDWHIIRSSTNPARINIEYVYTPSCIEGTPVPAPVHRIDFTDSPKLPAEDFIDDPAPRGPPVLG